MVYDDETAVRLWPEYFDSRRTRSQGRKVPKELSVERPSLDMIAQGAILLDLDYKIEEESAYPGNWTAKGGCVRVEKGKMKKTEILTDIGKILVKNQA